VCVVCVCVVCVCVVCVCGVCVVCVCVWCVCVCVCVVCVCVCVCVSLTQRKQFSLWATVCFHLYIGLCKAKSGKGGRAYQLTPLVKSEDRDAATSIPSSDENRVRQRQRVA